MREARSPPPRRRYGRHAGAFCRRLWPRVALDRFSRSRRHAMAGPPARMMMATAPAAAFIGHQASAADYLDLFRSARGADLPPLRGDQITALLRHLDPMPICDLMLRSPVGTVVKACYLDAFLLVDEQWQPAKAVHRVQAACYEAARTG